MKLPSLLLIAMLALARPGVGWAQSSPDHATQHALAASAVQAVDAVDGEVRKIDRAQGKITLKHGPIPNLDMPGMTMVFRVVDPKLLEGLQAGDRIRFAADNVNGVLTVRSLEVAH